MIPYIKINTPFERDTEGTKKLIEGNLGMRQLNI